MGVCVSHISRDEKQGDYRTTQICGKRVIAINVDGENVQAYYNTNDIDYRKPSGTITYDGWATTEKPLHCEVKHGGMVWVTLMQIQIWMLNNGLLVHLIVSNAIDTEEMEVFHYHKAVLIRTINCGMTQTVNFIDFMHYFNRVSGFNDEYFARKNIPFINGHVNVSSFTVNYEEYEGFEDRGELSFPNSKSVVHG